MAGSAGTHPHVKLQEVVFCIMVHYFVKPPTCSTSTGRPFNVKRVRKDVAQFLLRELNCQDSLVYPSLAELYASLARQLGDVGEEVAKQVHIVLQGLHTPDDLYCLFEALEALLVSLGPTAAGGVHPDSPLGLLLRRTRILFRLMPFEAATQLHMHIARCLEAMPSAFSQQQQQQQQRSGAGTSRSHGASTPATEALVLRLRPKRALEEALSRRMERLEGKGAAALLASLGPARGGGGEAGPDLEEELASLDLPGAILLKVAAALRAQDYTAAVDALHRHYDYAQAGDPSAPPPPPPAPAPAGTSPTPTAAPSSGRGRYQLALLGLSDLHAAFGHTHEALKALSETMCIAQQAGDQACLGHCLASLQRLMVDAPGAPGLPGLGLGGSRTVNHDRTLLALLKRCLSRGHELHLPHLSAFARVGLVRSAMMQHSHAAELGGEPQDAARASASSSAPGGARASVQVQSSQALRDLSLLHHAASLDAMSGVSTARPAGPWSAKASVLPTSVLTMTAGATGGNAPSPLADIFEGPAVHSAPGGPAARAASNAVMQAVGSAHLLHSHAWLTGGSPTLAAAHAVVHLACYSSSRSSRAEDADLATALLLGIIKDKQGLDAAAAAAAAARPPSGGDTYDADDQSSKPLLVASLSRDLDDALAAGDTRQAELLLHGMADLVSPAPHLDSAIRAQVLRHHALICQAEGRLSEAYDTAMELFCLAAHIGMQVEALQSLLLLADVHVAVSNWSAALLYVLSAFLHASTLHHDTLAAEALVQLTRIWRQLCPSAEPELRHILNETMPLIVATGSRSLRARGFALTQDLASH